MTLDELALKYDTDKSSKWHNYVKRYDAYFASLRDKPIKILEIGIQNGYSLKTWKDYFSCAQIYGIDIVDCKHMDEDRITTLLGSQSDLTFLKKVNDEYGPFDIIIDDGSHNSSDMQISMDFLLPLLNQGGLYVVEDIHCVYWTELADGGTAFMDRLKELMDYVNSNGKCGLAEIGNIQNDHVYQNRDKGEMNWWEQSLEYVHLYRSIVFIKKYDSAGNYFNPPIAKHSPIVLIKRFLGKVRGRLTHLKHVALDKLHSRHASTVTAAEVAQYRKKNKIFDVFTYNGEADILEIRLNILNNYVDKFIIVEAKTTFSGKPKPLYFQEQQQRFAPFMDKITYFVINDYPNDPEICALADQSSNVPFGGPEHWRREFYQKESIKKALVGLHDDDICYIGDVDEIWNPDTRIDYSKNDVFKLEQQVSTYYLDNLSNEPWAGTLVTKYKNIKNSCLNHLRTKGKTAYTYVKNGGWHFTNIGGVQEILRKIEDSYTEESYNTADIRESLESRFGKQDYMGRNFNYRTDETGLPVYILNNKTRYSGLFSPSQ